MKFINKKIILIVIILMVGIIFLGISKPKDNIKLENVNLRSDKDISMFAIMLEQEDGTYKEDNSNIWPTSGYAYNESMSGCIDITGNEIENSLSYNTETKNVSLRTKEASYCYLYFSLPPSPLDEICDSYASEDECLIGESIWNSTLEGDDYRYVGTNPNNYICFGTTNQSECIKDTDKYMYRIIGIFEDNSGTQHFKLIKKEALNTSYKWNNSNADVDWDESNLFQGLNGDYFLKNTAYSYMQDSVWTNKIATWNYTATNTLTGESSGPSYSNNYVDVADVYLHELNRSTKTNVVGEWKIVTDKIGLMYVSDYALSLGNSSLSFSSIKNKTILVTGWMHLSNNDSSTLSTTEIAPPSPHEWTMSRAGADGGSYNAWYVNSDGAFNSTTVDWGKTNGKNSVRPVFYLTSNIKILGGTGSIESPYIIE